jgi:methionine-rich copper-binding protein CopC
MRPIFVFGTLFSLLLGSVTADAHAFLDRANPRVGSTTRTAPREVSLSFTENLEAAFSSATVTDAAGQRVDSGNVRVSGNTMRISLRPLRAGTYRVNWRALSVDTHTTEGSFSFGVGE